jgi:hypothetical protein
MAVYEDDSAVPVGADDRLSYRLQKRGDDPSRSM